MQQLYPAARLEVHGAFQTAALLWHEDDTLGSLWVDVPPPGQSFYPAANPEVEASSIAKTSIDGFYYQCLVAPNESWCWRAIRFFLAGY